MNIKSLAFMISHVMFMTGSCTLMVIPLKYRVTTFSNLYVYALLSSLSSPDQMTALHLVEVQ